ncbi:leucine-rich repeat receptor-like protein kinase PXC2 [Olea europaea var. sylvestris]|uniref:leucine-rich repeat receptor-like protein kinase PXC2 n=1 Tax=Olea europaea var. sylvestris TaxID=158386 RepID=UPI000C1D809F|nr:leucine-rich repeat receptor-like protein kinase PXC2 [Olea europaea var. sylvestris]
MKDGIRCIEEEREALLKFKDELIDEYGRLSSWGNEKYKEDCCKWSGVSCDNQTNHIVRLDLQGPLDGEYESTAPLKDWFQTITKLNQLKSLVLSSCNLPMVLPSSPFNTSNSLLQFVVVGNEFSSSRIFPLVFNLSSSLSFLDLSSNKLHGEIPISLGNMSGLTSLFLSHNQLTGKVPCPALSSSLTYLDLSRNMFNGTIAQCIGSLSKLESLYLGSNNFEDVIAESHFFNLSQLKYLDLSFNPSISFNISLGWNPPFQLTSVDLSGCKVGPHFPAWLRTQTTLEILDISNAEISGTVL